MVLDTSVMIVIILAFAIAARLVGDDSSMLPWLWYITSTAASLG
jgi:hypothetical protein